MANEFFGGVARVIRDLKHGKDRIRAEEGELSPEMALLRDWQSNRLKQTYHDLLENDRFRPACLFFLNDVYAPRDFSRRDQDMEHIYTLSSRFIPEHFLLIFKALFELNSMTNNLDQLLLRALTEELGMTDEITAELYAQGYRVCDNYADRKYQIELLAAVIHDVGAGTRDPLVWPTLQVARVPASLGGWQEIYEFAVRGYQAFKAMRHPDVFSRTIEKREMQILDRIFAGDEQPFAIS